MTKRIAVIGSGISGLVSANLLSQKYAVTMFEAGSVLGGHTSTINVEADGRTHAVDLGFNIFNPRFYRFIKDIIQFNADAKKYLTHAMVTDITIGEFIQSHHYSIYSLNHI